MAQRRQLDVRDSALLALTAIAAVMFLRAAAALFIPMALAWLLSYALNPAVALLERVRVPRPLGAALCVLAVVVGSGLGVLALKGQAAAIVRQLPEAAERLRAAADAGSAGDLLQRLRQAAAELHGGPTGGATPEPGGQASLGASRSSAESLPVANLLWQGSSTLMTVAADLTIVAFLTFFLLVAAPSYYERFIDIGPSDRRTARDILDEMNRQIERFILVRIATAALVAVATGFALALLGVENPVLWGLLAGLFNSIPYFGPVIVSGGLAIVGLVQFGSIGGAALVAGVALGITTLEGWLITPPLLGKVARMSAVAVFVGLLAWGWIWGVWGTLLAMPMLVVIQVISHHFDRLAPVARLLDA